MPGSTPEIYGALVKVMESVGAIGKDQTNAHQHYKFRGIDDVYNAVQPALVKHGVVIVPSIEAATCSAATTITGKPTTRVLLRVRHTFYAADGSSVEAITGGEAMDTGDRATAKAMTDAYKAAIFKVLCIPVAAEDDVNSDVEAEKDTHELSNGNGQRSSPTTNSDTEPF